MKKIEFEALAAVRALDSVVIYEFTPGQFELWAYPIDKYEGSNIFKTAKNETRTWASLNVMVKFIRSMGYHDAIKIETPKSASGV